MRFHCNTLPDETINYLRYQAIDAKQPPAVIDAIDALRDLLELSADLEKRDEELNAAERARDDIYLELEQAAESLQLAYDILASIDKAHSGKGPATFYDDADLEGVARQLEAIKAALERHKA